MRHVQIYFRDGMNKRCRLDKTRLGDMGWIHVKIGYRYIASFRLELFRKTDLDEPISDCS